MSAIEDIAAERARQINVEGWTPEHDDEHSGGEMARAAACYALVASRETVQALPPHFWNMRIVGDIDAGGRPATVRWPIYWPWAGEWWKPKNQRADLIRAAALLVAEIERLDRSQAAHRSAQAQHSGDDV